MNKVSVLRGYGVAVITSGIALIIARPLNAESSCFVLAVIASSLFGGRGPGLLAVLLSAIAFDLFFLPSPLSLSSAPSSFLRFGVFLVVALASSQLIETRRRSEEALRTIQARLSRATRFATVAELAASIAADGLFEPLVVITAAAFAEAEKGSQIRLASATGIQSPLSIMSRRLASRVPT